MVNLTFILIFLFFLSLLLSYQSFLYEKTTMDIVNEMGIGYNLGYSFDSYNKSIEINNPEEQITLMGNPIPTKKMILNIRKYGFKTIRFPVTWINFIDEFGNVQSEWMKRVKEVVKWIIEKKMYCILNLYNDEEEGNWLREGIEARDKYVNLWTQIAEEFKDYNEYLIFEEMNKPSFYDEYNIFDYNSYNNLSRTFIDIIRNSGGINSKRLIIIPGMHASFKTSFNYELIPPNDPANKLAMSFHYYYPEEFTTIDEDTSTNYYEKSNYWGGENNYKEIISDFDKMKKLYLDNGIPIIISEIGVITEKSKDKASIREYLYTIFSLSLEKGSIVPCLWDTSNKEMGYMNFYDREKDEWYDIKLKEIFYKLSKKKNEVKSSNFYDETNKETTYETNIGGEYEVPLNDRKPLKIILNTAYKGILFKDYSFSVYCQDKTGDDIFISFGKENGKKQYDGTIIYTFDISDLDCKNYIQIIKYNSKELIFNNLTIVYNETFNFFNYKAYKARILEEIN